MARRDGFPLALPAAGAAALPGAVAGAAAYLGADLGLARPLLLVLLYGSAIVGAAFLLAWAAEAVQVDVSAGLALAVLALIAVLPEYAVDFVFSLRAGLLVGGGGECGEGEGANPCALALANMTGANRVLVGIGWPLIVLVAAVAVARAPRRERTPSAPEPGAVQLAPPMKVELAFLAFATLYSLTLPLKDSLTLLDAAVLVGIFGAYAWRLAQAPAHEPELVGTAQWVGERSTVQRRLVVGGMFAFGGLVVLVTAEHFADALVDSGERLGIERFVLVQWVAPIASESPELLVACLYAWRLNATNALGALLSSKVNQWTLLVGTIPIVFAIASGGIAGLPIDTHQRFELLLTAAQSLFALAILVDLRLTTRGATALVALFSIQFATSLLFSPATNRLVIAVLSAVYVAAAVVLIGRRFRHTVELVRDGTRTPMRRLAERERRGEERFSAP